MELSRGSLLKSFAGLAILPFLPKLAPPTPPPSPPPPLPAPTRPIVGWRFTSDHYLTGGHEARSLPPVCVKLYDGDTLVQQMYCPQGAITQHLPMSLWRNITRAEVTGGAGRFELIRL